MWVIFRIEIKKSQNACKEQILCSFKPQISDAPKFDHIDKNKDLVIIYNNKYYERTSKARNLSTAKKEKLEPDYITKYDYRKRYKNNSYCATEIDQYVDLLFDF